jgi:hypothetical protein
MRAEIAANPNHTKAGRAALNRRMDGLDTRLATYWKELESDEAIASLNQSMAKLRASAAAAKTRVEAANRRNEPARQLRTSGKKRHRRPRLYGRFRLGCFGCSVPMVLLPVVLAWATIDWRG